MTRGGPGITTETLDMYAFSQGNFIQIRAHLLRVEHGGADDDRDDCGLHCSLAAGAALARRSEPIRGPRDHRAGRGVVSAHSHPVDASPAASKTACDIVTPTPMLFFTPTLDNFLYDARARQRSRGLNQLDHRVRMFGVDQRSRPMGFLWPTPSRDIRCASQTTSSSSYCR